MQDSIDHLKIEAAKVGANGLVITRSWSQSGGAMGYSFGSATSYGNPYGATVIGSSTTIVSPIYYQCAKGVAIYVQQSGNPISRATVPQKGYIYPILMGDTLPAIAQAYSDQGVLVTADQILEANPGLNPSDMTIGKKIFIPVWQSQ